jgi:nucleotide-binding universal stress UspA family protein
MFEVSKILCPVDLDDSSLAALEYALEIAERNRATLYLLHVARTPAADMDAPVAIQPHPHWEREAREWLEKAAGKRLDGRVSYQVLIRSGVPETVIMEVAAELEPDLIVMATHGRTGLSHLILGSVAEAVVREAACPVLTVKPRANRL